MNKRSGIGVVVAAIVIVMMFAGCIEEEKATQAAYSTPTPTPIPAPTVTPTLKPTSTSTPSPIITVGSYDHVLLLGVDSSTELVGYSSYVDTLRGARYTVHAFDAELNEEVLSEYGVIVIGHNKRLSKKEVTMLIDWIDAGGGIMMILDHYSYITDLNAILLSIFGMKINDDEIENPRLDHPDIPTTTIANHPITQGVTELSYHCCMTRSLKVVDPKAQIIVKAGEDDYSKYYTHNPPIVAVSEAGKGRVVVASLGGYANKKVWAGLCNAMLDQSDNRIFGLNAINWLAHKI